MTVETQTAFDQLNDQRVIMSRSSLVSRISLWLHNELPSEIEGRQILTEYI